MYQRFLTERAVYQELGLTWSEFTARPAREVEEYLTIISMIHREQSARSNHGKGAR